MRKDVERAFGVLQARFAVVRGPTKLWKSEDIANVMKACTILHNMIVQDERGVEGLDHEYDGASGVP